MNMSTIDRLSKTLGEQVRLNQTLQPQIRVLQEMIELYKVQLEAERAQ